MSRYESFLSPTINISQRILTLATRERLVNEGIINERPNEEGFDILVLPENAIMPITFSDCQFHNVPYKFASRAFLEYLGIKDTLSHEMLSKIFRENDRNVDGKIIYNYLKAHIKESLDENGEKWQNKFGEGVSPISLPVSTIIMEYLGFNDTFYPDLLRLKVESFRDPTLINYYRDEEASTTTFRNLNMTDYILATLLRRLENLRSFEHAAKIYLED